MFHAIKNAIMHQVDREQEKREELPTLIDLKGEPHCGFKSVVPIPPLVALASLATARVLRVCVDMKHGWKRDRNALGHYPSPSNQ